MPDERYRLTLEMTWAPNGEVDADLTNHDMPIPAFNLVAMTITGMETLVEAVKAAYGATPLPGSFSLVQWVPAPERPGGNRRRDD